MKGDAPATFRALGIRAEPDAFTWAVVEGTRDHPVLHAKGKAKAPAGYAEGAALTWFRERIHHLLLTYDVSTAGIRYPEAIGRGANRDASRKRSRLEGVALEALSARGIDTLTGSLITIGSQLGIKKPKGHLEGDEFRGLSLSSLNAPTREAIIVGVAQLAVERDLT